MQGAIRTLKRQRAGVCLSFQNTVLLCILAKNVCVCCKIGMRLVFMVACYQDCEGRTYGFFDECWRT